MPTKACFDTKDPAPKKRTQPEARLQFESHMLPEFVVAFIDAFLLQLSNRPQNLMPTKTKTSNLSFG